MQIRRFESSDVSPVVELMNRCGKAISIEEFERDLDEPGERTRENSFVAVTNDTVVGCIRLCFVATATQNVFSVFCFGEVDPPFRRQGIGHQLYQQAIQHLDEVCKSEGCSIILQQSVDSSNLDLCRLLAKMGFVATRRGIGMRWTPSLAPRQIDLPDRYTIRSTTVDDASNCAIVYNDAFSWRKHATVTSVESILSEMSEPNVIPALYPILIAPNGTGVGYAHCSVSEGDGGKFGEIQTIAISREYQGLGLGKALLNYCLQAMRDMGVEFVGLSVESDNPSVAKAMYESVGFVQTTKRVWYEQVIDEHAPTLTT